MNPRYPIYIPSYNRADSRLTVKTLEYMRVPYFVVVEPSQYLQYATVINSRKILVLPKPWWKPGEGLIHTRNWIWEHAKDSGAKRFWQLDDNIKWFYRFNNNIRIPVNSGTIFRCAEDFVDRYTNVAQAGFQYDYFVKQKAKWPAFVINTRIYSCTLNLTELPFRYKLMYNDDTDMSLQCLQAGWCTMYFNAFLCGKVPTMQMQGGNASIYKEQINGRLRMAEALQKAYPDIVTITKKWNRFQHKVDYSGFKGNELKLRLGLKIADGINNYGMELIKLKEHKSIFSL